MDKGDVILIGGVAVAGFLAYRFLSSRLGGAAPSVGASAGGDAASQGVSRPHADYGAAGQQAGFQLASQNYLGAAQTAYNVFKDPHVQAATASAFRSAVVGGASNVAHAGESLVHTVSFGLF